MDWTDKTGKEHADEIVRRLFDGTYPVGSPAFKTVCAKLITDALEDFQAVACIEISKAIIKVFRETLDEMEEEMVKADVQRTTGRSS